MTGTVGIDVGGTFTDLYFSGSDTRPPQILKVPSTRTTLQSAYSTPCTPLA